MIIVVQYNVDIYGCGLQAAYTVPEHLSMGEWRPKHVEYCYQ